MKHSTYSSCKPGMRKCREHVKCPVVSSSVSWFWEVRDGDCQCRSKSPKLLTLVVGCWRIRVLTNTNTFSRLALATDVRRSTPVWTWLIPWSGSPPRMANPSPSG